MLKVLVIGANGMLGVDVCEILEKHAQLFKFTRDKLDITNDYEIRKVILEVEPNVVINCSGYTNVDYCEIDATEAFKVNGESLIALSKVCNEINAKLVHISSDYVFDGRNKKSYRVDDIPNPINKYGKSKLLGEENLKRYCENYLLIRTQWLFGKGGNNFIEKIISLANKNNEVNVVNDQFGSPTYTKDLAYGIYIAIKNDITGTIHITNSGYTTWYQFTKDIFDILKLDVKVNPVDSNYFKGIANRPKNSILDNSVFNSKTNYELRNYKSAICSYFDEKTEQ